MPASLSHLVITGTSIPTFHHICSAFSMASIFAPFLSFFFLLQYHYIGDWVICEEEEWVEVLELRKSQVWREHLTERHRLRPFDGITT